MKQEIGKYIDSQRENMLKDLEELIAIPSIAKDQGGDHPFGDEAACAIDKTIEICKRAGLEAENLDYFCADINYGGESKLGILAHVDVVPVDEAEWNTPPFACTEKDGVLYGRGVADDKGPVIASIYALKCIKELGIPLKSGVRLIFGAAEEIGTEKELEHYWKHRSMPEMIFTPDAAFPVVNGEKGIITTKGKKQFSKTEESRTVIYIHGGKMFNSVPDLSTALLRGVKEEEIKHAVKSCPEDIGYEWESQSDGILVKTHGKAIHSQYSYNGKNALTGMMTLLEKLDLQGEIAQVIGKINQVFPHGDSYGKAAGMESQDKAWGTTTTNFSLFDYENHQINATFEYRYPEGPGKEQVKKMLQGCIEKMGLDFDGFGFMLYPHFVEPDSALVSTLLDVYHDYTGNKKECLYIGGGSYVHNISTGVAFGPYLPGEDYHIHESNERYPVEELLSITKMIAEVIEKLCG